MNNPLINPGLGTFVWMLVSFGILVFILAKWGWPMLLKALKERETEIDRRLDAADKARREAAELQSSNESSRQSANQERDEILRRAREDGEKIREEARQQVKAEIERMRMAANESIENEKQRAIHDMKNEIAAISIDIAEKIIKAELSDTQRAMSIVNAELEKL